MTGPTTDRSGSPLDTTRFATELVTAVDAALPSWVRAAVESRYPGGLPASIEAELDRAGERARADIVPRLRELLALDVDDQWTNPLSLIRAAVEYPTRILESAGVAPVDRDDAARRFHPDDRYDLVPASFADLGSAVAEAGLAWGAAKAHVHLARRKRKETA